MKAETGRRIRIGSGRELEDAGRITTKIDGREIVAFHVSPDEAVAYENTCPHMGGPVCEGKVAPRVEAVLGPDREVVEERFVSHERNLVCPWHGYEFNLRTGACRGDARFQLRRYETIHEDGEVYVLI